MKLLMSSRNQHIAVSSFIFLSHTILSVFIIYAKNIYLSKKRISIKPDRIKIMCTSDK